MRTIRPEAAIRGRPLGGAGKRRRAGMRRQLSQARQRGELMVVVAGEAHRPTLVALFRAWGFEVVVPPTPLDAVQLLLAHADRIGMVALSPGVAWAGGLAELLADEFPEIPRVTLPPSGSHKARISERSRLRARGTRPPRYGEPRPFALAI